MQAFQVLSYGDEWRVTRFLPGTKLLRETQSRDLHAWKLSEFYR